MVFSIVVFLLFATLIFRIEKARTKAWREKITLFLFFFLYAALTYEELRLRNRPAEIPWIEYILFISGAIWFWSEFIWGKLSVHSGIDAQLKLLKKNQGPLYELVMACELLSQAKMGALIVLERRRPLDAWHDKGISVDSTLNREILFSIFTPPGALHDGAVFIKGNRVICAAVIVPLTQSENFRKDLGTRHRAGVGLSEVSDALCLIVSEETGGVSIADQGVLYYDIPFARLAEVLNLAFRFKLKNKISQKIGAKKILNLSSGKESRGKEKEAAEENLAKAISDINTLT